MILNMSISSTSASANGNAQTTEEHVPKNVIYSDSEASDDDESEEPLTYANNFDGTVEPELVKNYENKLFNELFLKETKQVVETDPRCEKTNTEIADIMGKIADFKNHYSQLRGEAGPLGPPGLFMSPEKIRLLGLEHPDEPIFPIEAVGRNQLNIGGDRFQLRAEERNAENAQIMQELEREVNRHHLEDMAEPRFPATDIAIEGLIMRIARHAMQGEQLLQEIHHPVNPPEPLPIDHAVFLEGQNQQNIINDPIELRMG